VRKKAFIQHGNSRSFNTVKPIILTFSYFEVFCMKKNIIVRANISTAVACIGFNCMYVCSCVCSRTHAHTHTHIYIIYITFVCQVDTLFGKKYKNIWNHEIIVVHDLVNKGKSIENFLRWHYYKHSVNRNVKVTAAITATHTQVKVKEMHIY